MLEALLDLQIDAVTKANGRLVEEHFQTALGQALVKPPCPVSIGVHLREEDVVERVVHDRPQTDLLLVCAARRFEQLIEEITRHGINGFADRGTVQQVVG